MSTGEHSITWRVALISAGSALIGALIGAVASVVIAVEGFERTEDNALRESREQVYTAFATTAQQWMLNLKTASSREDEAVQQIVDEVQAALYGSIPTYASGDTTEAFYNFLDSIVILTGSVGTPEEDAARDSATSAFIALRVEMRDDLDADWED